MAQNVQREANTYEIIWEAKPLGFSIVMDTTGRNAYVSSIQKKENLVKGLKLAAQIVEINGTNVKGMKHQNILGQIKGATLPMSLVFQPRSFANEPREDDRDNNTPPEGLLFGGAPTSAKNRVDGVFELVETEHNGRSMWQRKDREDDPILLWWWPAKDLNADIGENLWMISRQSQLNTQNAYACCPADVEFPNQIPSSVPWKVWNKDQGRFVECELSIAAEVNTNEEQLDEQ